MEKNNGMDAKVLSKGTALKTDFAVEYAFRHFERQLKEVLLRIWISLTTEAYKGHCVLCKDVLSFVFQTFDFQVLCFGFCVKDVSCVVGRTCGPTPLLAIYAIKYVHTNIPFS